MSRPLLEVIATSAEDARRAAAGGADRLELVSGMVSDGSSPSVELFSAVREAVDLPIRVMLRLGDGFAADRIGELAELGAALRAAGADAFVLGFLDADGAVDAAGCRKLLAALPGCAWTFHRALDHAADRQAARAEIERLPRPDTLLTAGSPRGVTDGLDTLVAEAAEAVGPGHEVPIMVGGGLRTEHVPTLRAAGVRAFHIGAAVRDGGWDGLVSAAAVRRWRALLD